MALSSSSGISFSHGDTLCTDVPSASASVIELQVAPISNEGIENLAYCKDNDEITQFQRNKNDRLSKKSLEIPFVAGVFKGTVETFSEKTDSFTTKDLPCFDEKLRSAFEKSVECVKIKRANYFSIKNRVAAKDGETENASIKGQGKGQDKGTNTEPLEVIVHPRSELQKSYSVGCLIYHLNASSASPSNKDTVGVASAPNACEESMTPVSCLPRSESLDTCLQGEAGAMYRYAPVPAGVIDWRNVKTDQQFVPSQQPPVVHYTKRGQVRSSRASTVSTAGGMVPSNVSTLPDSTVFEMPVVSDVVVEQIPPKRKLPVRAQSTVSSCSSFRSDARVCRICWFSEDNEPVIQPCLCSGSTAFVHSSCLQKWLSVTNNFKCEICLFKFKTKKKMKPVKQWRWKLEKSRPRSQLEATVILLAIVTPPLICGIILCSQKIVEFLNNPDHSWGGTGMPLALMTLVLASTLTYLVAVFYFLRKLGSVCCLWVKSNETTIVQLGDNEHMIEHGKDNQSIWAIA